MAKIAINTTEAPATIGPYSPAIKVGNTVYFSGQIPLDPKTNELLKGEVRDQVDQIFKNLKAVAMAAGGDLHQIVRVSVYLLDLNDFPIVNEVMKNYFHSPYPARTTLGVCALPKNAKVEVDAIMVLDA